MKKKVILFCSVLFFFSSQAFALSDDGKTLSESKSETSSAITMPAEKVVSDGYEKFRIGGYGELYLWADRASMQIESSEHVQFIQDNTVFRGKARADGMPIIPGAFVAININNAEVTTVMDFAADTANDANLNALAVGTETLSPGTFDPNTTTYTLASAASASDKIEATPARAEATVEISYNGKNVRNGDTVTWLADGQPHPLPVTVKNGNAVKVYTVNVTKASGT